MVDKMHTNEKREDVSETRIKLKSKIRINILKEVFTYVIVQLRKDRLSHGFIK